MVKEDKIIVQVTIRPEKHPELWEKLTKVPDRSRAEVLRHLALRGMMHGINILEKAQISAQDTSQDQEVRITNQVQRKKMIKGLQIE